MYLKKAYVGLIYAYEHLSIKKKVFTKEEFY